MKKEREKDYDRLRQKGRSEENSSDWLLFSRDQGLDQKRTRGFPCALLLADSMATKMNISCAGESKAAAMGYNWELGQTH